MQNSKINHRKVGFIQIMKYTHLVRTYTQKSLRVGVIMILLIVTLAGCFRNNKATDKIPLTKVYDNFIQGNLIGWCHHEHPIIPVIEQDDKVVFCKETALQNVATTIDIPGKILSCKFNNIRGNRNDEWSNNSGNWKPSESVMTFLCEKNNNYQMQMYTIKNISKVFGGVDLEIEKNFCIDVDKLEILSYYHNNEKELRVVCLSDNKKKLVTFDTNGVIIDTYILDNPTIFFEDVDFKTFGCYGFDGSVISSYIFTGDKIRRKKHKFLPLCYDINDSSWDRGPSVQFDYFLSGGHEITLNVGTDLFIVDMYYLLVTKKIKNKSFNSNLAQSLYKNNEGLFFVSKNYDISTDLVSCKRVLKGDFDLYISIDSISGNPGAWCVSEKKDTGNEILQIEYSNSKLYVARFEPIITSDIRYILFDLGFCDFSVITTEGVYKCDTDSGVFNIYNDLGHYFLPSIQLENFYQRIDISR
jgi:hypothetical protein